MPFGRERSGPLYLRSPSPSSGHSTEVLQDEGVPCLVRAVWSGCGKVSPHASPRTTDLRGRRQGSLTARLPLCSRAPSSPFSNRLLHGPDWGRQGPELQRQGRVQTSVDGRPGPVREPHDVLWCLLDKWTSDGEHTRDSRQDGMMPGGSPSSTWLVGTCLQPAGAHHHP